MIEFIGKTVKSGQIPEKAREIARLVIEYPCLYIPMSNVIIAPHKDKHGIKEKIEVFFETSEFEPELQKNHEAVANLKCLLIEYYTLDDAKFSISDRRGLIVEEIVSLIEPSKFGFNYPNPPMVKREAKAYKDRQVLGEPNIDVLFEYCKLSDGIECKANLYNYLMNQGEFKERVHRKLKYLITLRGICENCGYIFNPWLCTFQKNVVPAKQILKDKGYDSIPVIDGMSILIILNKKND